jgi:hypothetical protein
MVRVKNFIQMQLKPLEAIIKKIRFFVCLRCKDFLFAFYVKIFGLSSMKRFLVCLLCKDFWFVFHVQIFGLSSV